MAQDPGAQPAVATPLMLEFMGSVRNSLGLEDFPQPGLHENSECFVQMPSAHFAEVNYDIEVTRAGDLIEWVCRGAESLRGSDASGSFRRQADERVAYKMRHDFVSEALTTSPTDVRLSRFFEPLNDSEDVMSPDILIRAGTGEVFVIEVATARSTSVESCRRVYAEKHYKYAMPLHNRALHHTVVYTPIVVTRNFVLSGYNLPEALVDELVCRMRIGVMVEDRARDAGFVISYEDHEGRRETLATDILRELTSIGLTVPSVKDKIFVTEAFVEEIKKEPDREKVYADFAVCVEDAKKRMKSDVSAEKQKEEYISRVESEVRTRSDQKPVVLLPFMDAAPTVASVSVSGVCVGARADGPHIAKLWAEAFSVAGEHPRNFTEDQAALENEAMEADPKAREMMEEQRKKHRKQWHRVNLKDVLKGALLKHLQDDGVLAKRVSEDTVHKARMLSQKRTFRYDTDTTDISDFLSDGSLFRPSKNPATNTEKEARVLLEEGLKLSGSDSTTLQWAESWMSTRLFRAMDLISDIAMELAISIKQNCKSEEMILKKLRHYDIYMLVKPTNSSSHVFLSLFTPSHELATGNLNGVFRPWVKVHGGYATEFVSFRAEKLENLAKAPSTLLTLASYWGHAYGMAEGSPANFKESMEPRRMLLLSLLVALEDKEATEEVITLTRYMYMEVFKGNLTKVRPNPLKMLRKFPASFRSRLALLLTRRIISAFSHMTDNLPTKVLPQSPAGLQEGEDALPGDEWNGLVNCLTGGPVRSASLAINISFIGYFKNKNSVAQGNTEHKMVEKILEEEFEVSKDRWERYYGEIPSGEFPGKKAFSRHSISFGTSLMERKLKRELGVGWQRALGNEISLRLAEQLTHEIATLKASSMCQHDEKSRAVGSGDIPQVWRVKVIEAIAAKLDVTGLNPMLSLKKILEFIEGSSAGVIADLFKKNQHGGLREIYVLTIESRIIQLFLETISRTICLHFEEETLTHPENKLQMLDSHKVRAIRFAKKENVMRAEFCSSSDKTRWNQNFVMTSFAIPLIRLTPPEFHGAVVRSLNLWANKLILIPPQVQELLRKKTPLSSAGYTQLLQNFWKLELDGLSLDALRAAGEKYMNLTTGMMQGILHYTSSLLHLTFLHAGKSLGLFYLRSHCKQMRFSMTQVCSSDDSATIISAFLSPAGQKPSEDDIIAVRRVEVVLESLTRYCEFFCMRNSEKSATAVPEYVEFNSEFILGNTLSLPTVKFVAACCNLTESESFIKRFNTMYNLISDLTTHGMPMLCSQKCQAAQLLLHYKSLGMNISALFPRFRGLILRYPDPVYGFFAMDNDKLCGVMGFGFCRWLCYTRSPPIQSRLRYLMTCEVDALPDGSTCESLTIKHGDLKRWRRLVDRVVEGKISVPKREGGEADAWWFSRDDGMPDAASAALEKATRDPELLFRHPRSATELKSKLIIKSQMPGVAQSLCKGNPFIQSLALSVYALNTHAFTKSTVKVIEARGAASPRREKKVQKVSLLLALAQRLEDAGGIVQPDTAEAIMDRLFPLRARYAEAMDVVRAYEDAVLVNVHRLRQRKARFLMHPMGQFSPLSLLQACSHKWFSFSVRASEIVFTRCWNSYQLSHPWLTDDFHTTLARSPFQTPTELYNYISTQANKVRVLHFVGPAIRSTRFVGQLQHLVRRHYSTGKLLCIPGVSGLPPRAIGQDQAFSKLTLSLMIPDRRERERRSLSALREACGGRANLTDLVTMTRREAVLNILLGFRDREVAIEELQRMMITIQTGMHFVFTHPQQKVTEGGVEKWVGQGECMALADGLVLKIQMRDDLLLSVSLAHFEPLRRSPATLRNLMTSLGLRPATHYIVARDAVARFNGNSFVPNSSQGTPVYVDPTIQHVYTAPGNIRFAVKPREMGLYDNIRGRDVALLKSVSRVEDLTSYPSGRKRHDIWEAWTTQSELDGHTAYTFITGLAARMEANDPGDTQLPYLVSWTKETFQSRLKYLGLGSAPVPHIPDDIEEPDADEDGDDEFWDMFCSDMDEFLRGEDAVGDAGIEAVHALEGAEAIDPIWESGIFDDTDEFEGYVVQDERFALTQEQVDILHGLIVDTPVRAEPSLCSIFVKDTMTYYYQHPIWDALITESVRLEPNQFSNILAGRVKGDADIFGLALLTIFGVERTGRVPTLEEHLRALSQREAAAASEEESPSSSGRSSPVDDWEELD